jgi:hypothetical protein
MMALCIGAVTAAAFGNLAGVAAGVAAAPVMLFGHKFFGEGLWDTVWGAFVALALISSLGGLTAEVFGDAAGVGAGVTAVLATASFFAWRKFGGQK